MLKNPTLYQPAQHPPVQNVQAASAVMLPLPCPASQMKPRITPSATQRPQSRSVGPRRASRRSRLRTEILGVHHRTTAGFNGKHGWFHHVSPISPLRNWGFSLGNMVVSPSNKQWWNIWFHGIHHRVLAQGPMANQPLPHKKKYLLHEPPKWRDPKSKVSNAVSKI